MRTTIALLLFSLAVAVPTGAARGAVPDADVDALIAKAQDPATAPDAVKQLTELGADAVPALTQGLWSESATMRRVCATVLAEIGWAARAAGPSLARALSDESKDVRLAAARALGALQSHAALPALTTALKDEAAAVRLAAAGSLIALGADAEVVLPVLIKSLKAEQSDERYYATGLLGELGPEAAPAVFALQGALVGADLALTVRVLDTLGRVGPEAKPAVAGLKQKLEEDKSADLYRVPAAIALWRIGRDRDAAGLLRDALTAKKSLRPHPHTALWRIDRSKDTLDALVAQLKSDDVEDVLLAANLLGRASPEALPELLRVFKKFDGLWERDTLYVRARIGPDAKGALEQLRKLAKEKNDLAAAFDVYELDPTPDNALVIAAFLEDKEQRVKAAAALAHLRPAGKAVAIELLVALDSRDEEFRLIAAVALWRIEKNAAALKAVTKLLRSAEPKVRERAAVVLGTEFGPDAKPAVPDLVKCLFDSRAAVRSSAAEALSRIGPGAKAAAPALVAVLEGDEPPVVYSAACEALGRIEPADKDAVVAALKPKLDHPGPLVRVHAALALALVAGDKSGQEDAVRGLTYRTHQVRITSAEALWRIDKDGRVVPLLIRALEESNLTGLEGENERYMAARALGRIGPDAKLAVPELLKLIDLIDARDEDLVTAARTALKLIDPDAAKKAGVK